MICLLLFPGLLHAEPESSYRQALMMAAAGQNERAVVALKSLEQSSEVGVVWRQRSHAASVLLMLRQQQGRTLDGVDRNPYLRLAASYMAAKAAPKQQNSIVVGLASLFPGAGHAIQGRWHDAATAAILVWPMLLLTLWAAKRRMGPVTLFFALITLWLWSGTIFSAWSLHERSVAESYQLWWQGVWQASGLPGRIS